MILLLLFFLIMNPCFADSQAENTISGYTASPHIIKSGGVALSPRGNLDFEGISCVNTGVDTVCTGGDGGWTTDGSTQTHTTPSSINVGIGSVSPQAKLEVDGAVYIKDTSSTPLYIRSNNSGFSEVNIQNMNSSAGASSDFSATADNGTSSTKYINMGINNSGGGSAPFTSANDGYVYSSDSTINIGGFGTGSAIKFYTGGSSSLPVQNMVLTQGGNLGIGTTIPTAKLQVIGTGTTTNKAFEVDDSLYASKFTVLDSGNVGINSAFPGATVDVIGTARFGGASGTNISANGGISTGQSFVVSTYGIAISLSNNGAITGNNSLTVNGGSNNTSGLSLRSTTNASPTTDYVVAYVGNQDAFIVRDASGVVNVGINSTAPRARLEVAGTSTANNIPVILVDDSLYAQKFRVDADGAIYTGTNWALPSKTCTSAIVVVNGLIISCL